MPEFQAAHYDPYGIHDRLHVRLLAMRTLRLLPELELWAYDDKRDSFWRLYVNATPGASIWFAGQELPIIPDRAVLVPAWVRFNSRSKPGVEHLYLHFDIVGLAGPLVREWFDRPVILPDDDLTLNLSRRVRTALDTGRHDDIATAFDAKSLISLAMARQFELLEQSGGEGLGEGRLLLRRLAELTPVLPALRRIDDHLSEPASNAELAERCGMSEDHFIRIFRKCVGQTPARYALERRVTFAAERLVFGDDSLKRIAAEAGFSNRFHFTRVFTRIIGVPPAQYRQRGRV